MNNKVIHSSVLAAALVLGVGGCATDNSSGGYTPMADACPANMKGNECAYYKDGYSAGAKDGQMGMSMAYQRHDGYDSRFESYFARGYEEGWRANR